MRRAPDHAWIVFGLGLLLSAAALAFVTLRTTDLEHEERRARALREDDERARLAVWRMDALVGALLAPEAARPAADYRVLRRETRAYDRDLNELRSDSVRTVSPLIAFRSRLIPIHFEVLSDGTFRSPQLPIGAERALIERNGITTRPAEEIQELLRRLQDLAPRQALAARLGEVSGFVANCNIVDLQLRDNIQQQVTANVQSLEVGPSQSVEFGNRLVQSNFGKNPTAQNGAWVSLDSTIREVGPLLPIWIGEGRDSTLVFVRRVASLQRAVYQGLLVDLPALEEDLLGLVADLFPEHHGDLRLERVDTPDAPELRGLASAPLRLATPLVAIPDAGWTPMRTVLLTAWVALAVAGLGIGFSLRRTLDLGARRARFASAVTHELRSPLTTFRMYTEMLDEGMVDGQRQAEYLRTLRSESDRLGRLVENVLAYARLEEGRQGLERREVTVLELIESCEDVLRRRAEASELELSVSIAAPDSACETDPEAVSQILFGLVDNACKHGVGSDPARIELEARVSDRVEIRVRDHGPGISPAVGDRLFEAFERGSEVGDVPGLGLGLAIARGLARAIGGRLYLDRDVESGAAFVLSLPAPNPPSP